MRIHQEIITLIRANIHHRKSGFFSVIILMLIISATLTTVVSVNHNIRNRSGEAMDLVGVGDLVVFISDLVFSEDMISKVKQNSEVASVELIQTLTSEAVINGNKQEYSTLLVAYEPEKRSYGVYAKNKMSFVKSPEALQRGEVYVPICFQSLYDCKLGDSITIPMADQSVSFRIKGFLEEPFVGAQMITVKLIFISKEDFKQLYPARATTREEIENSRGYISGCKLVNIVQKSTSKLKASELKSRINSETDLIRYGFATLSKDQSKSYTLIFIQFISGILYAFIILLFIITLIVMGHNISSGIEMDYVNLGVLKTQGFTKGMLRKVFLYQYFAAEFIGVILGLILCIPCIRLLNQLYVPVTGLLASTKISMLLCGALLILIVAIGCASVFIKTKRIAEISPICAISGGRDSSFYTSRLTVPISKSFLHFKLALRQLTSNLRQYISSAIIVAILVFFMIMVTTLNSISDEKTIKETFGNIPYDISIDYSGSEERREEIEHSIQAITGIDYSFQKESEFLLIDEEEYCAQILSDPMLFKSILKGRAPLYENEIIVTELTADSLGKTIGDKVQVTYQNITSEYIISGTFQSVENAGMTCGMSLDAIMRLDSDFIHNVTYYQLSDSSQVDKVLPLLKDQYGTSIDVVDSHSSNSYYDVIVLTINMTTYIIYAVSILFALVVVLLVCDRVFLKEKQSFGIYKAFGFTSTDLRLQFSFRFLIIAMLGCMLGILANILWSDWLMSILLNNVGITSYITDTSVTTMIVPFILISLCFFLFAYLIAGKIKRVDTKELIVE